MQTFEQLRQVVTSELNKNAVRIAARRNKVTALARKLQGWKEVRGTSSRFRIRTRGASLTINESTLRRGGASSLYLNVEVLGARVGTIEFSIGRDPTFSPADALRRMPVDCSDPKDDPRIADRLKACLLDPAWEPKWSKNQRDAELLHCFLRFARRSIVQRSCQEERVIQALLNSALAARKSGPNSYPVFKGYQPVVPGAAMEIGTVLSSVPNGENTGQADILVRHEDTEFLVFELKRPDGDAPAAALTQAIRYALALEVEANADVESIRAYRSLFGSRSTAALQFGAFAVVAEEHEAEAAAALRALGPTGNMSVGVLFYRRVEDWTAIERLPVDGLRFSVSRT